LEFRRVEVSDAKETYEWLNIEPRPYRAHMLAAITVGFGEDERPARTETISLSGFTQLNHWPMPGYAHRVGGNGRAEFDVELIAAPEVGIKGFSYTWDDRIQLQANPFHPNVGTVRQAESSGWRSQAAHFLGALGECGRSEPHVCAVLDQVGYVKLYPTTR
jgi:hypothetical protein